MDQAEADRVKQVAASLQAVLSESSFNRVAPDPEDYTERFLDDDTGGYEPYYDEDAEQGEQIPF